TAIEERVSRLDEHLREELSAVPGVTVCDRGARRCGIVTFTVDGVQATRVKASLSEQGINTTVSYAANARYDLPVRGLGDLVRAPVHCYRTEEELGRLTEAAAARARTA